MKTALEILDSKFKEHNIRKGWLAESKQSVLDAMEEYASSCVQSNYPGYNAPNANDIKNLAAKYMASGKTMNGGDSAWIEAAYKDGMNDLLEIIQKHHKT